jgi:hypothetical protein
MKMIFRKHDLCDPWRQRGPGLSEPREFCSGAALLVVLLEKKGTQIHWRTFMTAVQDRRQQISLRLDLPALNAEAPLPALAAFSARTFLAPLSGS